MDNLAFLCWFWAIRCVLSTGFAIRVWTPIAYRRGTSCAWLPPENDKEGHKLNWAGWLSAAHFFWTPHIECDTRILYAVPAYRMWEPSTVCGNRIPYAGTAYRMRAPHSGCGRRIQYAVCALTSRTPSGPWAPPTYRTRGPSSIARIPGLDAACQMQAPHTICGMCHLLHVYIHSDAACANYPYSQWILPDRVT